MERSKELIYGLNDRPPIRETIFAVLQYLLTVFVVTITSPFIISSALKFDLDTTGFPVSMPLFVSGLATFVQCRRFDPIGTSLLCTQGTSFSFISPIVGAGMLDMINDEMNIEAGLSYILGVCFVTSIIETVVSCFLPYARRITTPPVLGIVVSLIGMRLIKAGINPYGDGRSAVDAGTFGSMQNLGLALLVLVSIIFFNRPNNRFLRMGPIVLGLLTGCVIAYILNTIGFSNLRGSDSLSIPVPFRYGLSLDLGITTGIGLTYFVTAVEAFGDITINSFISGEPVEGPVFLEGAQGGVLADGFNSFLAAAFNSSPSSISAQNNGMIRLTGVASRYVGYFIADTLVLLGLFPVVGKVFSLIPDPVLGGAASLMFSIVAVVGVRAIASTEITRKAVLVMAISFVMDLSVELVSGILDKTPDIIKNIFSNGITIGGPTAILANASICIKE